MSNPVQRTDPLSEYWFTLVDMARQQRSQDIKAHIIATDLFQPTEEERTDLANILKDVQADWVTDGMQSQALLKKSYSKGFFKETTTAQQILLKMFNRPHEAKQKKEVEAKTMKADTALKPKAPTYGHELEDDDALINVDIRSDDD